MRRRTFNGAAVAACVTATVRPSWADNPSGRYPNKPITFVVPFAAGGGGDVVARLIGKNLSDRISVPVLVENRLGAGGNIGASYVLRSPPDGYTLLSMSSTYPIQAAVSKPPFDPIADMQPIMMVSRDAVMILVHPDSPIRNARDLVDAARRAPGRLTYASAGVGSLAHLGVVELAHRLDIQLAHIPYKGTAQAINDLLGKNVDMLLSSVTFIASYLKAGTVRSIGVSGPQRSSVFPDMPTFAEQGYPGYDVVDWKAMAGPKGMPPDVVAYLNTELNETLKVKSLAERFATEGTTPIGGTPDQMMQIVRSDIERWKNVAAMANVKIE